MEFEYVLDKLDVGFLIYSETHCLETELYSLSYKPLSYSVLATEEQGGCVVISSFLPPTTRPIKKLKQLLSYLGKKLQHALVEFDPENKNFSVTTYLSPGCHEEELNQFQIDCDLLFPPLLLISQEGIWDINFVDLVLAPRNTLPQA